jgi:hypothetical protein
MTMRNKIQALRKWINQQGQSAITDDTKSWRKNLVDAWAYIEIAAYVIMVLLALVMGIHYWR